MSVENGANPAANDTAVSTENTATETDAAENTEAEENEGDGEEGEEGKTDASDDEELDIDGEKVKVSRKIREALAKPFQQDYTKKTTELAAEREALKTARESQQAHFQTATKLAGLDEQLSVYKDVDWPALYNTNPDAYHQHKAVYDQLRDKRDAVARDFSEKEKARIETANRETGERVQKVQAEIARLVPEWTPGGDLDGKLQRYGNELGFSNQELSETAIRNPQFVKHLNRLRLYDEAAKKQKTSQTFQQTQQAKPVTQVGGNSGTAVRRTTDSSGDKLSDAEWAKRETERVAARRAKAGR